MRVISQDGTIDLPYEQVIIQCFKKNIYFLNKNLIGVEQLICDRVVAKYSTEEKAKKAMEMLRKEYQKYASQNYMKVFQFPAEEELE